MYRIIIFIIPLINFLLFNICYATENISFIFEENEEEIQIAAFKRAGTWRIIFDKQPTLANINAIKDKYPIELDTSDNHYVLYISLPEDIYINLDVLPGHRYTINFLSKQIVGDFHEDPHLVEINDTLYPYIPSISGNTFKIHDIYVGDELWIIPEKYSGKSWQKAREYTEFSLFPTVIGTVLKPLVDNLMIIDNGKGKYIGSDLNVNDITSTSPIMNDIQKDVILFNTVDWGSELSLHEELQRLRKKIITLHPGHRMPYRLKIVKLYMAHKMYQEAQGYLEYIYHIDYSVQHSMTYQLLCAANLYYLKEYKKSYKIFSEDIDEIYFTESQKQELRFWRDSLKIKMGEKNIILKYITNAQGFLLKYVDRKDFVLTALESAISNNLWKLSDRLIKFIINSSLNNDSRFLLLKTKFLLHKNTDLDLEEMLEIYDELIKRYDDPFYRAMAYYDKTYYLYNTEQISLEELINSFETIRHIYRGSNFDENLLQNLGKLYIEHNNFYKGMMRWKELLQHYPNGKYVITTSAEMGRIFYNIFSNTYNTNNTTMEHYDYIRIFYEFQEFIPVGERGIEVMLNVINHMDHMDLLDQSINIFSHLINYRLSGDAQIINSIKLSNMYWRNLEYENALNALEKRDFARVGLQNDAQYMRAQILLSMTRYSEAEKILQDINESRAKDLLLDLYIRTKNWKELVILGEQELEYRDDPTNPLSIRERKYLRALSLSYLVKKEYNKMLSLEKAYTNLVEEGSISKFLLKNIPIFVSELNSKNFNNHLQTEDIIDMIKQYNAHTKLNITP